MGERERLSDWQYEIQRWRGLIASQQRTMVLQSPVTPNSLSRPCFLYIYIYIYTFSITQAFFLPTLLKLRLAIIKLHTPLTEHLFVCFFLFLIRLFRVQDESASNVRECQHYPFQLVSISFLHASYLMRCFILFFPDILLWIQWQIPVLWLPLVQLTLIYRPLSTRCVPASTMTCQTHQIAQTTRYTLHFISRFMSGSSTVPYSLWAWLVTC